MLLDDCITNIYDIQLFIVEIKRKEFWENDNPTLISHSIRRTKLYNDVFTLLSNDEILEEYPLKIRFSNKVAIDTGGVCRDMFVGFWEDEY